MLQDRPPFAFVSTDNVHEPTLLVSEILDTLFATAVLNTCIRIASELKERCPGVPLMVFARGATYANVALQVRRNPQPYLVQKAVLRAWYTGNSSLSRLAAHRQ